MKLLNIEFKLGAINRQSFLEDKPQVAIMGRSNAGKSSLLNMIFETKKMVKISRSPGKTRELNYFEVNRQFYFVDVPGLGYAKLSHTQREKLAQMIDDYFHYVNKIKTVLYVMDIRVLKSKVDLECLRWLRDMKVPVCVVLTKADKINQQLAQKSRQECKKIHELDDLPLIASSLKKRGRLDILQFVEQFVF